MYSPLSRRNKTIKQQIRISVKAGSWFLLLAFAVLMVGCGNRNSAVKWPELFPGAAARSEISSVPFYPQEAYQCGPAALAMALEWSGRTVDLQRLSAQVFTPALKGSLQPALTSGTRRNGRLAYVIFGGQALIREIDAGHPVIVLQNLGLSWYPVWHYAVVIGYDLAAQTIRLHSGKSRAIATPLKTFYNTWARSDFWGLLVLPPAVLPATATESSYINAVIGLEQAGRPQAAVAAYTAALEKWPGSKVARLGLGNNCYATGDLQCAEAAFRDLTHRYPDDGVAFNNLAMVLSDLGRQAEAVAAARRAVAIGGRLKENFIETLETVERTAR